MVRECFVAAPGKLILHGEHAVVHQKTAIAASLDLEAYAHVAPFNTADVALYLPDIGPDHRHHNMVWSVEELRPLADFADTGPHDPSEAKLEVMNKLLERLLDDSPQAAHNAAVCFLHLYSVLLCQDGKCPSVHMQVLSTLPIGAGLGSSAAFSVSLAAGLLCAAERVTPLTPETPAGDYWSSEDLQTINNWGFQAERIIHGNPSGIDNTVSAFGRFQRLCKRIPSPMEKTPNLRVMLVDTTVPRSTKELVAGVGMRLKEMPLVMTALLDSMEAVTLESESVYHQLFALQGANSGDQPSLDKVHQKLEYLIDVNHSLLNAIGVGHAQLDLVCRKAAKYGLHAKLTGAGGGGCAFVFLPEGTEESNVQALKQDLTDCKMRTWVTSVGGPGVRVVSGFSEDISKRMKIVPRAKKSAAL